MMNTFGKMDFSIDIDKEEIVSRVKNTALEFFEQECLSKIFENIYLELERTIIPELANKIRNDANKIFDSIVGSPEFTQKIEELIDSKIKNHVERLIIKKIAESRNLMMLDKKMDMAVSSILKNLGFDRVSASLGEDINI